VGGQDRDWNEVVNEFQIEVPKSKNMKDIKTRKHLKKALCKRKLKVATKEKKTQQLTVEEGSGRIFLLLKALDRIELEERMRMDLNESSQF
jgi:hypothetical protein